MIIDFHTHIFPEKIADRAIAGLRANSNSTPYSDGKDSGLINALTKAKADIAVVLPVLTKPTQFDSVLNFALEINEKYKNADKKIISFAGMHPDCEDIENKLKTVKESGLKGVKIHPDFQNTFIDDPKYVRILEICKDLDLIVVTHSGVDDGYKGCPVRCTPERVLKVIKKVKHDKFVLAHYGAHREWEDVLDILAGENVYFDTAFTFNDIDENLFKKILEKHGEDKILFATDSPWRDIKEDVDIFNSYNLSAEIKSKILYKNAIKLLEL